MENKNTGKIILFYILMFLSCFGGNVETFLRNGYDFNEAGVYSFLSSLISLIIISVAMMLVPCMCRVAHKNSLPYKRGKTICLWNSIALFILSCILIAQGFGFIGGIGAIFFYFINKWLFVDASPAHQKTESLSSHTRTSYSLSTPDETPKRYGSFYVPASELAYVPPENNAAATSPTPASKVPPAPHPAPTPRPNPTSPTPPTPKTHYKYCSKCGNAINPETKKCTGCGKQYFKGIKWKTVLVAVLILLLVISIAGNVYLYSENIDNYYSKLAYVRLYEDAKTELHQLEDDIANYEQFYDIYYTFYRDNYDKVLFVDNHVVFIADDGTNYYHKYECCNSDNYIYVLNTEYAKSDGYSPCPLCFD